MSLSGNVQQLSLSDLLQVSAMHRRTCRVALVTGEHDGELFLESGEPRHARYGELFGPEAFYALIAADDAEFTVEPDVRTGARTMSQSLQHLLLEAARRLDEGSITRPTPRAAIARAVTVTPATRGRRLASQLATSAAAVALIAAATIAVVWLAAGAGPENGAAGVAVPAPAPAPARAEAPEPVDAAELTGAGDIAPALSEAPPPIPPGIELALAPTIVVRMLVDTTGAIADARVYRSRLDLAPFEEAALDAAQRYRFSPAIRAGAPVPAWVNVPITFDRRAIPAEVLRMKGSDTIGGELGPALARGFERQRGGLRVEVEALGSSTAFVGLFDGTADVGASSRAVRPSELEDAERLGLELTELVLGYDGIAVVVHPDNPVTALSTEQLAALFSGEIVDWSAVGGEKRPVRVVTRPSYSGTHGFFRDKVVRLGDRASTREITSDGLVIEHSDDVLAAVAADPSAIAYVGLGWLRSDVAALAVSLGPNRAAVRPTVATVRDGSYPIYRPLLLYTRGRPRGTVARFARFVSSAEGQRLVASHGFVPSGAITAVSDADEDGVPMPAPRLVRVHFGTGDLELDHDARAELARVAAELRDGGHRVVVFGNADARGSARQNERVSTLRARRVADYLIAIGAPAEYIDLRAAGASSPLASNADRGGRSANRRADVFIVPRRATTAARGRGGRSR